MKKVKLFFTVLALAVSALSFAQNIVVTGVVSDAKTNEAVPFASIQVKGTLTGANTDADGMYSITVPSNGTLIFSSVGYTTHEVEVAGRAIVHVALEPDTVLDDVIVVAYGTSTKNSFTGSATVVKSEEIAKKVTTSVTNALSGTTPGVQVISANGDPASGGAPAIRIRGIGSMYASSSPLIVLDGVPYDGSISDINPNDVESMSVLKDAAASAIYGHRGANGVVIITTKKGNAGDAVVKFDARLGSNSRLVPQYDVITDPGQYYEEVYKRLYNSYMYSGNYTQAEAYESAQANLFNEKNGGVGYKVFTVPEGQTLIGNNGKLNPNAKLGYSDGEYYYTPDNWYDEVFHSSFRQEYNLSIAGAGEKFNYYASVGYLNDGGVVNNSGYQRFTGRINAEYQVKKWFKVATSLSYSHSSSQYASYSSSWGSSGNIFYITNNMGPIYPLYVRNADGTIMKDNGRIVYDSNNTNFKRPSVVGNAVRDNEYDRNRSYADVVNAKGSAIFTPVKGLNLTATVGVMSDNTRSNALYSVFGSGSTVDGMAYVDQGRYFAVNQQYLAQYKRAFGDHNVDVLAGYEQYNYTSQNIWGENDHLFNPEVGELNNADGSSSKLLGSSTNHYMTEGFLARAQYDYAGRYFLSASVRRDASSRFAVGHQWGTFWSVGGAWLVSSEPFFNFSFVDMFKLKVSYGLQGNDALGSYPYADQYTHSYNEDTKAYSIALSYKGNEELTWETSKSLNTGFDFELFHGYLNGSVEFFSRKTEDLLYYKDVPLSSGNPTGQYPVNVGDIRNSGVEVTLDGNIISTKNVNWRWNLNLSHYKNRILALDPSVSENGIKESYRIYKVGGSIYEAYMYKYAGVDKETGEALYWKHVDEELNPDGSVKTAAYDETTNDFGKATKYEIGTVLPKVYGGFGTSINAYGFDFSVQASFQLGGKYYDGGYQQLMWTQDNTGSALHKDILKAWTPENTDTNVPRVDGDVSVSQSALDRFLTSSNYICLNNITLGYTVPSKLTQKAKISNLRFYVAGENLALATARKGMDPRNSLGLQGYAQTTGSNTYSALRTITGGVTLQF